MKPNDMTWLFFKVQDYNMLIYVHIYSPYHLLPQPQQSYEQIPPDPVPKVLLSPPVQPRVVEFSAAVIQVTTE